jgi:hypothetical protein
MIQPRHHSILLRHLHFVDACEVVKKLGALRNLPVRWISLELPRVPQAIGVCLRSGVKPFLPQMRQRHATIQHRSPRRPQISSAIAITIMSTPFDGNKTLPKLATAVFC